MENENVQIILNNEGEDYHVVVDLQTAHILLNDPEQASQFVKNWNKENVQNNIAEEVLDSPDHPCSSRLGNDPAAKNKAQDVEENTIVWCHKRPTENDNLATEYFLNLREKYSSKFDDRKTVKSQIWTKIAEEMQGAGFYVGTGRDAIEKCRLKFANLQKQYLAYLKHVDTTGEERKDKPPFFELMHSILGEKDYVNPTKTDDSFSEVQDASTDKEESVTRVANRFRAIHHQKPKGAAMQMIDLLKIQHTDDKEERKEQFTIIQNLLKEQNEQRSKLLQQVERLIDLKSKKRNYSEISDSE